MMHLVRLYLMAFDILERGEIITYREADHDFLMEILNGKYLDEKQQPIPEFFDLVKALEEFKGVYRRFNTIGKTDGVEVIDDFAHNPHKLAATLKAAHLRGKRVLAFFQPHAFTSVQLLLKEFIEEFTRQIKKDDILWLSEIYYAGGTIPEHISSKLIYEGLKHNGVPVKFLPCRNETAADIAAAAKPGDVVLVMGARDPTLTDFAKQIFRAIKDKDYSKKPCRQCLMNVDKKF
ncbi:glutamate ligase domain-containing protein [Candidatus Proelusimicrobium excrementi]|uniref:glutamate ligase domain-containing protein n=1 Tax=Candidatus Proelusimicrobium excrementi TaxID=3416222 RepID=UPI003D14B6B8